METESQPARIHWLWAALLSGTTAAFFWQLSHPIFRFDSSIANNLVGLALGLGLPWLTVVALFRIRRWWGTALAILGILPVLLWSFLFLLASSVTLLTYKNGHDSTFDRFAVTRWKGSEVRFYRTNWGATTSYGVVIRQERPVFPGVMLVRPIDDFYPCASLEATGTEMGIRVTDQHSACREFPDQPREYRLKRFVYF